MQSTPERLSVRPMFRRGNTFTHSHSLAEAVLFPGASQSVRAKSGECVNACSTARCALLLSRFACRSTRLSPACEVKRRSSHLKRFERTRSAKNHLLLAAPGALACPASFSSRSCMSPSSTLRATLLRCVATRRCVRDPLPVWYTLPSAPIVELLEAESPAGEPPTRKGKGTRSG